MEDITAEVQFHGWGDGNEKRASGGGATHIALIPGVLSSLENNIADIIMVAGGRRPVLELIVQYGLLVMELAEMEEAKKDKMELVLLEEMQKIGATQDSPGMPGGEDTVGAGIFGKGGSGASANAGLNSGGGAGLFGGGSAYLCGGGGSGYVNTNYLKKAQTVTSTHTGNGECKITELK